MINLRSVVSLLLTQSMFLFISFFFFLNCKLELYLFFFLLTSFSFCEEPAYQAWKIHFLGRVCQCASLRASKDRILFQDDPHGVSYFDTLFHLYLCIGMIF